MRAGPGVADGVVLTSVPVPRRLPPDLAAGMRVGPLTTPTSMWTDTLTRTQAVVVDRTFDGPCVIRGAVGTGKTLVALHRAIRLARARPGRILVTALSPALPDALRGHLAELAPDVAGRVDLFGVHALALALLRIRGVPVALNGARVAEALDEAWRTVGRRGLLGYLEPDRSYWEEEIAAVIQTGGLLTLEEYLAHPRNGRRHRLGPDARRAVWALHEATTAVLRRRQVQTLADVVLLAESELSRAPLAEPYSAVIVDDAQDLSVPMLRLLRLLAPDAPDGLTVVGDARPSLSPGCSTLEEAGIVVEGRVVTLDRVHRTPSGGVAHAIESSAGRVDCAQRLVARVAETVGGGGATAGSVAVLTLTHEAARFAAAALESAGLGVIRLDRHDGSPADAVVVGTVKAAVGLDFAQVLIPEVPAAVLAHPDGERDDVALERWELGLCELAAGMTRAREGWWVGLV